MSLFFVFFKKQQIETKRKIKFLFKNLRFESYSSLIISFPFFTHSLSLFRFLFVLLCVFKSVTMQRQSLGGSPGSKLHQAHGGAKEQALLLDDAPNRSNKDLLVFSTSTSSSISADDDHKASKPHRLSSPPPTAPHKSIHVIPVLTLLCFLILFLFSHSPSQSGNSQSTALNSSRFFLIFIPDSRFRFRFRFGSVQWLYETTREKARRYNADN